jgi:hypothetical protein
LFYNNGSGKVYFDAPDFEYSNQAYHFVILSDGGLAKLYIDGKHQTSIPISDYVDISTYPITTFFNNGNDRFSGISGTLDHVRFFDRPLTFEEVQDLYEEHPGWHLILDDNNNVYTYDFNNDQLIYVTTYNNLNDTHFETYGLITPFYVSDTMLNNLPDQFKIVTYLPGNVGSAGKAIGIVDPDPAVAVSIFNVNIQEMFTNFDGFEVDIYGSYADVKFAFSPDGQDWYALSGLLRWNKILSSLDINNQSHIQTILDNGMSISQIGNVRLPELLAFPDRGESIYIAVALKYNSYRDNGRVTNIYMRGTTETANKDVTQLHDIRQYETSIVVDGLNPNKAYYIVYED